MSVFTRFVASLAAMICCVFAAGAHAATQELGTVLPEAGLVKKPFLSVRELKYVNLVTQQTDFSCGAAALATILKYAYGRDVTEREVIEGMMAVADAKLVHEQGFSMLDMKRYVEAVGLRGRGYNVQAQALEQLQVPTIAVLDVNGFHHFVVLKKTVGDRVYIGDPALGNRVMSKSAFVSAWNGIVFAVVGKGFDRQSVLLNPQQPLTMRNRGALVHSVPTAQLLEFGFTHADLF
jgi:predicted double-glycine peptidase